MTLDTKSLEIIHMHVYSYPEFLISLRISVETHVIELQAILNKCTK